VKRLLLAFSILALVTTIAEAGDRTVRVKPYTRSDGVYVERHIRTAPDNSNWNNYSS
jgi:hypothetical protein